MDLYNELLNITAKENILVDEPMAKHTTFRTGGTADFLVIPSSKEENEIFDWMKTLFPLKNR